MSRPGFVLEVDQATPPVLIGEGAGVRLERLPNGTKVLYPAESLPGVVDLTESLDQALRAPLDSAPLADRLRPGMTLTVVVTDGSRPAPSLATPDLRALALEQVLTVAAEAGVDDVRLVVANGLRRKQTEAELQRLVGERVHRSFAGQQVDGRPRLANHDAEAPDLVELAPGITVNPAVAQADLVINLVISDDVAQTGWEQLTHGVTGARTAWAQVADSGGLGMVDAQVADEVAGVLADKLQVFEIELVLDQRVFGPRLGFWGRREWEWTLRDRAQVLGLRQLQALAPHRVRRLVEQDHRPAGVLQVSAGAVDAVAAASRAKLTEQRTLAVPQADVLLAGPAPVTEHNQDAVMNPLIAAWDTLGRSFAANTGTPLVREGGAMILFHPLREEFSSRFHSASADFFADVLSRTTDTETIRSEHEQRFLTDEWYANLYRTQNAFHGSHPLQLWFATRAAVQHCADVIWVGADRASAERMGMRAASTLADALEIASASVGRTPAISALHTPPKLIGDVQ